jgi:hypothetical protein
MPQLLLKINDVLEHGADDLSECVIHGFK